MIGTAQELEDQITVHRTKTSNIDALAGALGEFAFAQWLTGNWKNHEVGINQGKADFRGIVEIKTSAYPFRDSLNLLVREDYARKRHPDLYVQVIIDVPDRRTRVICAGTEAVISGFTPGDAIGKAPLKDFGSKYGTRGGYCCRYIQIRDLIPMTQFRKRFESAATRLKANKAT